MHTFSAGGREWRLTVDYQAIRTVRDRTGVNLLELFAGDEKNPLANLSRFLAIENLVQCVDVLWALCAEQAAAEVSDVDFGRGLVGPPIEAAQRALVDELIDFFPNALRGQTLRQLLRAEQERDQALWQAIETGVAAGCALRTLTPEQLEKLRAGVCEYVRTHAGAPPSGPPNGNAASGDSPALLESAPPAALPGDSSPGWLPESVTKPGSTPPT